MLTRSFIHVPGIGHKTEEALWRLGFPGWTDYLSPEVSALPFAFALPYMEESARRLERHDAAYFGQRLRAGEVWRMLPEFFDRACFLDIETTGLSYDDSPITVVGVYDGRGYRAFIKDENLRDLPDALEEYRLLVTFNGKSFDGPFIEHHFGRVLRHMAHLDLRYPLRRLGYRGGLKAIEHNTGHDRGHEVHGVDGYDAVLLWREYERGRSGALETLVRYNAEDVVGLPALAVMAYNELASEMEQGWPAMPPVIRPSLDLPWDQAVVDALRERHLIASGSR